MGGVHFMLIVMLYASNNAVTTIKMDKLYNEESSCSIAGDVLGSKLTHGTAFSFTYECMPQ